MILEPVIRPPSEAGSFLLQVTTGCSANTCTFCGAYLEKPFRAKPEQEIFLDIEAQAARDPETRRVFLMDGDALALSGAKLLPVLEKISGAFPKLTRIASYASGQNLTPRTDAELRELADRKLKLIYLGLESGSQAILDRCEKKATVEGMIDGVRRAQAAGIKASVIVLLGLGGRAHSREHVTATVRALNRMQPRYLSFLSLMLIPGTKLYRQAREGGFQELSQPELLRECRDLLAGLEMEKTVFRANHASNYLPLEGRLPQDKDGLLAILDLALSGGLPLRPDFLRAL